MAESVYAASLRKLGFAPQESDFENRDEALEFLHATYGIDFKPVEGPHAGNPIFYINEERTVAVDEIGEKWTVDKPVDLTFMGFTDIRSEINPILELMGLIAKKH